jgi:crotonobetainyl-CoA:carnitine CoA-transferase CaiB-like acyl-CoA transferase
MPAVGLSGPYTDYLGFGIHYETLCGFTAIRGYADMDPTANGSVFHMDAATGPAGAFAALAALRRRQLTGVGELIELAQAENMMGHIGDLFVEAALSGVHHGPLGNRHRFHAPQGVYRCRDSAEPVPEITGPGGLPVAVCGADRWVAVSVGSDAEWAALARLCGREDLAGLTTAERRERHDELDGVIGAWSASQDYREAAAACRAAGVPAGAVLTEGDCFDDPQLRARGFFRPNGNAELGTHEYAGHAFRWTGPDLAWKPIPLMGEHNEAVFRDVVGFSDSEWAAHLADGHVSLDFVGPDGTSL